MSHNNATSTSTNNGSQSSKGPHSPESLGSVGIGSTSRSRSSAPTSPSTATSQQSIRPRASMSHIPSLTPEGATMVPDLVFDCIVYLIYCPDHDTIAVNNFEKNKCTWLPFVVLPEGMTWEQASHEGVDILIGRNDPEMESDEAERCAPAYQMEYLQILRIQLPSKRIVLRLSRFIHLEKNEYFQCCQNTDRVNWIPFADVRNNQLNKPWGPEVRLFTTMILSPRAALISEFTPNNALFYMYLNGSWEQAALRASSLTDQHIFDIYTDYIEHCYPAFYMCYESFRAYLLKYGYPDEPLKLRKLFHAFQFNGNGRHFVDFHEFLVGIVILEPTCSSKLPARSHFIYRYYDGDGKGHLNVQDFANLLKDANTSWTDAKAKTEAQRLFNKNQAVTYKAFIALLNDQLERTLNHLCRSPRSVLRQVGSLLVSKHRDRARLNAACDGRLKAKRTTKGTCWSCRAQQYEYGNHCVTIDTVGRCVEPNILGATPHQKSKDPTMMARARYSLEYVFTIGSVPNIFIDLVRDFYHKASEGRLAGLMASQEDSTIFIKYLRILCKELSELLMCEPKFVKVNAPAIVVGDLHGNLHNLIQLENLFFQSFPILSENLIFLGNYSGEGGGGHGIECLVYLCALKLLTPNKVFLLRGTHEMSTQSSLALKEECIRKYDSTNGSHIYEILVELIFSRLPVALLIDDNILCTHSGIPTSAQLDKLLKLPREMRSLKSDSPLALELITRYPQDSKSSSQVSCVSRQSMKAPKSLDMQRKSCKSAPIIKSAKVVVSTIAKAPKSVKSAKSFCGGTVAQKSAIGCSKTKSIKSNKSVVQKTSKKKTKKAGYRKTKAKAKGKGKSSIESIKSKKRGKSGIIPQSSLAPSNSSTTGSKSSSKSPSSSPSRDIKNLKTKSNASGKSYGGNFLPSNKIPKSKGNKLKPTFLTSTKVNRKSIKFKSSTPQPKELVSLSSSTKSASQKSGKISIEPKKSPISQVPTSQNKPKGATFDRQELADFLRANDLAYLIRSHSVCSNGFKIEFAQQCLTVFSCSNYGGRGNQAAVALIDGSSYSIRFVRLPPPSILMQQSTPLVKQLPEGTVKLLPASQTSHPPPSGNYKF